MISYYDLIKEFQFKGDFLTFQEHGDWLACYEKDAQKLKIFPPFLVYRPHSIKAIAPFIRACAARKIPVRVRCGGTSLTASSVASQNGVILLTSHFNHILDYDPESGRVVIQPGVTVSQLNHFVQDDEWEFPLEMMTNGVAGIGGCLSCHAKGYLQNYFQIYNQMREITLIDGEGELLVCPWSLICGSEGIFGVIIQIEIQLLRIIRKKFYLRTKIEFEQLMEYFPALKEHQSLKSLFWFENQFLLCFEGEEWRLEPAIAALKNVMQPHTLELTEKILPSFNGNGNEMSLILSAALPVKTLIKGKFFMENLAEEMRFQCQISFEVFSGRLQVYLSSTDSIVQFQAHIEKMMVVWVEFLEDHGGFPISAHGRGQLWNNYMTPFIDEENFNFLKWLQKAFDPHQIFSQSHFFPEKGKCLVRNNV